MPNPLDTIVWLSHGWDIHVSQQCHLSWGINLFKYELLCDVALLKFYDVILRWTYMWKCHVVYEPHLCSPIITLGCQLYRELVVVPTIWNFIDLRKIVPKGNVLYFNFFPLHGLVKMWKEGHYDQHSLSMGPLYTTRVGGPKIVETYRDTFIPPLGVPLHCEVKHLIDFILTAPLP